MTMPQRYNGNKAKRIMLELEQKRIKREAKTREREANAEVDKLRSEIEPPKENDIASGETRTIGRLRKLAAAKAASVPTGKPTPEERMRELFPNGRAPMTDAEIAEAKAKRKSTRKAKLRRSKILPVVVRVPRFGRDGFVYFIKRPDTGRIKIGHARNVATRLLSIQTANDVELELVFLEYSENRITLESERHSVFSNCRFAGEWFDPSAELMDYLNKNRESTGFVSVWCRTAGLSGLASIALEVSRKFAVAKESVGPVCSI